MTGLAVLWTVTAAAASRVTAVLFGDAATPTSTVAQAGVFTVVLVVGYYLIRRSDDRETKATAAAQSLITLERDRSTVLAKELADARAELATVRAELEWMRRH